MTEYFKDVNRDEAKRQLSHYYTCMQHCDDYTRFKQEESTYFEMLHEFNVRFPVENKK